MQPIGSPLPCTHMHNDPVAYMSHKSRVGCRTLYVHPSLCSHPRFHFPLWPKSGPRTKERKLVGRRAEIGGTKEGDVGRIML